MKPGSHARQLKRSLWLICIKTEHLFQPDWIVKIDLQSSKNNFYFWSFLMINIASWKIRLFKRWLFVTKVFHWAAWTICPVKSIFGKKRSSHHEHFNWLVCFTCRFPVTRAIFKFDIYKIGLRGMHTPYKYNIENSFDA